MSSARSPLSNSLKESGKVKSLHRPGSAGGLSNSTSGINFSPATKTKRKGSSPIMHKLAALFRRNPDHEEGVVPVRPACFDDDRYQRNRSESPTEMFDGGKRRNSNSSSKQYKVKKSGGKDAKQSTRMWRPKVSRLFESDWFVCRMALAANSVAVQRVVVCSLRCVGVCRQFVHVQARETMSHGNGSLARTQVCTALLG